MQNCRSNWVTRILRRLNCKAFYKTYPNSTYTAEAKELLVSVLANTNNYKDALTLYESLRGKSESVKRVYPKILLGRAVELINDQQLAKARCTC